MASKARIGCSLNTTECILETVTSILGEIQEQNNEYNWDPLTFVFTAIIGVVALLFTVLTAFQSFLAAGPGRTKSGAYAIGPWSWLNRRKFDMVEMRFRTTASTPILTINSFNPETLQDDTPLSQDAARLRKGEDDYFPATWLALLSYLALDKTKFWDEVKITGADFIPSELSAVPAYGSIRFVAILAMILSRGFGRLTIDRETGLPRVRDRRFNLVFRHHPLLGVIGFFEMYGRTAFLDSSRHREMYERLLQAHGHMDIAAPKRDDERTRTGRAKIDGLMMLFRDSLRQECPHLNQQPEPACRKLLRYLEGYHPDFLIKGPLNLLVAHIPRPYPFVFPHKRAKLSEKLTTLLLQSRFWSTKSAGSFDLSLQPSADEAHNDLHFAETATSWARSQIGPDIEQLELSEDAYTYCLAYLDKSLNQEDLYDGHTRDIQLLFRGALESIDLWLKQLAPHVFCRKLVLGVVGDGIQQLIDTVQQESNTGNAALLSTLDGSMLPTLHGKLGRFLEAMNRPGNLDRLYSGRWCRWIVSVVGRDALRRVTLKRLGNVQSLWEMEPLSADDEGQGSEERIEGDQEQKGRAWKLPATTLHQLDDVLIYRAVLITLMYCLSSDSSDLMDDAYDIIVPIM